MATEARKTGSLAFDPDLLDAINRRLLDELQADARLTIAELGRRINLSPPAVADRLQRLERAGVIARHVDPTDRRARALYVTARGIAIRQRVRPALAVQHNKILAPLSLDERTTLIDLLTRVVEGNESYARPGHGRRAPSTRLAASAPNTERGKR